MTIAQRIAEHVATPHVIDDELAHRIDLFVFDYLAVTVGGVDRPSAEAVRRAVPLAPSPDELRPARIHGLDAWARLEDAALVNGITAHGLELDDTHEAASMHPGVAILPAVFAVADARTVTVEQARRAITVGYDAMTAVGVLLGAAESYGRGFHPTGVCGSIGAAAAVAALLELDAERAAHALSLAANMAAGSLEFLSDGSWTKRLNAGHAAATGIRAARLAEAGFLGPAHAFEGRDGFLRLYGKGEVPGRAFSLTLGRGVRETSIKLYPCCRYMHGNIDLLRELHDELPGLALEDVAEIECAVISAGAALVSEPAERKQVVTSSVDAQFNMPFGAAIALATGRADVDQFDRAVEVAEELGGWMRKVRCVTADEVEAAFPEAWHARVRVTLTDGRVLARGSDAFRGSPARPALLTDIVLKASKLVDEVWSETLRTRLHALTPGARFSSETLEPTMSRP